MRKKMVPKGTLLSLFSVLIIIINIDLKLPNIDFNTFATRIEAQWVKLFPTHLQKKSNTGLRNARVWMELKARYQTYAS